jgi:hypothetical protein
VESLCEHGDEPSDSGATELVICYIVRLLNKNVFLSSRPSLDFANILTVSVQAQTSMTSKCI